jgi:hypothetical protein
MLTSCLIKTQGFPSGSRRTSASFDTSLSDDILCQLVEPDEILDSQIPVCTNTKSTSHIDDVLSFFHEEPKSKVKEFRLVQPADTEYHLIN